MHCSLFSEAAQLASRIGFVRPIAMTNKVFSALGCFAMLACGVAQGAAPKMLAELLPAGTPVRGEIITVAPPKEIAVFMAKVDEAAKNDPTWYTEFAAKAKPGVPLPFDEKLGLTKSEYDEYLKLWAAREVRTIQPVVLQLIQKSDGEWSIQVTGAGSAISILRYIEKEDVFKSPNGPLKRIEDINADEASTLGAWNGHEWRFEEENTLGRTKENFAIGKMKDGKFNLLVYRAQEVSAQGTRLYDKSLVIRFAPLAAAPAPAPKKP
jgi:hypothetical protein